MTALQPEVAPESTLSTNEAPSPVLAPRGPFQPQAITRSADHRYTYQGMTYPGVTGILDVVDKSGPLMGWAARMTAEAAVASVAILPSMLETSGPAGVVKFLTARSSWKNDEAKQLGTDVHELADRLIRGETMPTDWSDTVKGRVTHYAEWWKNAGWTVRASEAMVIHPTFGYGGTLDLLCLDRDKRTVLADIKTGKGVYSEAVLQLTAYGLAELIQTEAGVFTMPKVDRYVILHVTADGVREIEVAVGTLEQVAWGACLDLHAWKETTKGKRL